MTKENNRKQVKPVQQEIKIVDNIVGAEYSNMMNIAHTKEEFNLFFAHVLPPTGKVVGKVTTSPGHLKRMIKAMQDSLNKYEKQFGKIDIANDLKGSEEKIGF